MSTRSDAINEALERLEDFTYLDAPGFANHGPMGAETLSTLGHDDLVAGWADQYVRRHQPLPTPAVGLPIDFTDEAAILAALGDQSRVSDWWAAFRAEMWERPWQEVMTRWAPRLLPGYAGGLTHGLIRTSHAIRALPIEAAPSSLMIDELAHALALWAASFKILPGRPQLVGPLPLGLASERLPRPKPPWPLVEAGSFLHLHELEAFGPAVEALGPLDLTEDPLGALSAQFCRVILMHPEAIAVPLVHTVTPIAAVRTLRPYLVDLPTDQLYAHLWHVGAAITVAFTSETARPVSSELDPGALSELLARAVAHQDPHVLKFSEACAREYTLRPDPIYLAAIGHVLGHVPGWGA